MQIRRRPKNSPPVWPDRQGRARVLVEDADRAVAWAIAAALRSDTYDVGICEGPESVGGCPLVANGRCAAAEGADVIVNRLSLSDPSNRAVLCAESDRVPDTPVVVEVPQPRVAEHQAVLEGCRIIYAPMTATHLKREVRDAVNATTTASHIDGS